MGMVTTDPVTLGPALVSRLEHVLWIRRTFWHKLSKSGRDHVMRVVWISFEDLHQVGMRAEALSILCAK